MPGKQKTPYCQYKQKIKLCCYRPDVFSVIFTHMTACLFNFLSLNAFREDSRYDLNWWICCPLKWKEPILYLIFNITAWYFKEWLKLFYKELICKYNIIRSHGEATCYIFSDSLLAIGRKKVIIIRGTHDLLVFTHNNSVVRSIK